MEMAKDLAILADMVRQIGRGCCIDIQTVPLQTDCRAIASNLTQVSKYIQEVQSATYEMAEGNFNSQFDKHNPFIGSIKDLQSSFHHLTWQITRVAQGDYEQSVDYMGKLSDAFNTMILQLKEREALLIDNVKLTKDISHQQTQLLEQEIERQMERYNQFSKSMDEIKRYRHDMRNHLIGIDALLQDGNIQETRSYIAQLGEAFKAKTAMYDEKNYILNALLVEKITKAKEFSIDVKVDVKLHKQLMISNMDWCILFGNALDNALEALLNVPCEQRKLIIQIISKGNTLCVQIRNTKVGPLFYDKKQRIQTTKKNKTSHGFGLKNIENCVRKYDGEINIVVEDDSFSLIFVLCDV